MDMLQTGLLIRGLIVLVMFCLLVIAGALLARREKHRSSNSQGDAPTSPGRRPASMQRSLRYPAACGQLEANDSNASAPGAQRHAA
jgi:hypothetical protein